MADKKPGRNLKKPAARSLKERRAEKRERAIESGETVRKRKR
ncbi:hypothetical protein ACQI4L_06865 [Mycolicibacterium litorale]